MGKLTVFIKQSPFWVDFVLDDLFMILFFSENLIKSFKIFQAINLHLYNYLYK